MAKQKKLALIGPPGSGKSTLAAAYGARTGKTVVDTDALFSSRYGDISAYFAAYGERAFREKECDITVEAARSDCGVIACGGGAVLSPRAMCALREHCDIALLTADEDVLRERISRSDRPLKNNLGDILKERAPLYKRYADYTVDTSCGDAADKLIAALSVPRGNRYDVVLCDSDDTLMDFHAAMRIAVVAACRALGFKQSDEEIIREFKAVSDAVWRSLERGEITRDQLTAMRFKMLADRLGETIADPVAANELFFDGVKNAHILTDGALWFCDEVRSRGIKLYVITNSFTRVAETRLLPLLPHVDGTFVSENVGFDKPRVEFFEAVHKAIGSPDKARILVVGDSLTSDIAGGKAFGVDACLFDVTASKSSDAEYSAANFAKILEIL